MTQSYLCTTSHHFLHQNFPQCSYNLHSCSICDISNAWIFKRELALTLHKFQLALWCCSQISWPLSSFYMDYGEPREMTKTLQYPRPPHMNRIKGAPPRYNFQEKRTNTHEESCIPYSLSPFKLWERGDQP